MLKKVAKLYSYKKAPKATFFLSNPIKATALKALLPNRDEHRTAKRVAMGVGAAAVALPVGYWLTNKLR